MVTKENLFTFDPNLFVMQHPDLYDQNPVLDPLTDALLDRL